MSPTFVLYHAHCADGFAAALAAWARLGDSATYLPVSYGEAMPEIPADADVYILDFSYPREELVALSVRCSVTVLDHHRSAQRELEGLPFAIFDMEKSGAVLAWEHFCGTPVPLLLRYVEDRDLWRWKLDRSREVSAGLSLAARKFNRWMSLINGGLAEIAALAAVGETVLAVLEQTVQRLCENAVWGTIAGHRVPTVNSPVHQSEIGEELLGRHGEAPFAAIYYQRGDGAIVWSLRSRPDFDVSEVAALFGGGGHGRAAGFEHQGPQIQLMP